MKPFGVHNAFSLSLQTSYTCNWFWTFNCVPEHCNVGVNGGMWVHAWVWCGCGIAPYFTSPLSVGNIFIPIYMWQRFMHRYTRWISGLSHQSTDLSCLCNLLQKVVICVLLDTRLKGIQVVNYLTNYQTAKVMLTKVFPKGLGACTWINKVHNSSRIYSCSMRGTDIVRVEGWWLNNGPNHSVPETQMTALRLELTSLISFPPQ